LNAQRSAVELLPWTLGRRCGAGDGAAPSPCGGNLAVACFTHNTASVAARFSNARLFSEVVRVEHALLVRDPQRLTGRWPSTPHERFREVSFAIKVGKTSSVSKDATMQRQKRTIGKGLHSYIQRHGPTNTLFYLASRVINHIFIVLPFKVAVLLVDDADWSLAADRSDSWSFLDFNQLRLFGRSDPSLLLDDKFLNEAFARGDRCYAYVEDGTLGTYAWYSTITTPLQDGVVATFHPDYIYMYKAFTAPAFRGRKLYGIGVSRAFRALIQEGGRKALVSYIEVHNQSSLKALRRIGFKPVGTVIVVGMKRPWISYSSAGCRTISRAEVA
jgi:ribosomal protein S18 acetylase RimI-like enzyme